MFEDLTKNLEQEKKIMMDLRSIYDALAKNPQNKEFYERNAEALIKQLNMLNDAIPELLKAWNPIKKLSGIKEETNQTQNLPQQNIVRMSYVSPSTKEKRYVTLNKKDKKAFLEELSLSEGGLKRIKEGSKKDKKEETNKPSTYARISNKIFRGIAEKLAPGFTGLEKDLKKGNVKFLKTTYISMMIMSTAIALIIGVIIFGAIITLNIQYWTFFWIILLLPTIIATAFYLYPAGEASTIQKKISQELPFATIHMAAIAGSDITPIKIFNIIAKSKEYKGIGGELKKVITQVEIYGYDIINALKNVAGRTSNKKLGELLSGIATNISTGGALKNYLQKKSENYLLDHKLERQKYADLAGTFMDVYISILIAAPLVLMMMFIVMNVAGLGMGGLTITALLFISVGAVIVINIIFIIVLNIKQPRL